MPWLPADFVAPRHVDLPNLPDRSAHLRPISPDDTEIDMIAVMGSQPRLWSIYGEAWGWPPATMTADEDRRDLARHAEEMTRNESFNYAVLNHDETVLYGCVYIDPPEKSGADAEISWWVIDELVGSDIETALERFVPAWVASAWPLGRPRYVGRDLSWSQWMDLPDR